MLSAAGRHFELDRYARGEESGLELGRVWRRAQTAQANASACGKIAQCRMGGAECASAKPHRLSPEILWRATYGSSAGMRDNSCSAPSRFHRDLGLPLTAAAVRIARAAQQDQPSARHAQRAFYLWLVRAALAARNARP